MLSPLSEEALVKQTPAGLSNDSSPPPVLPGADLLLLMRAPFVPDTRAGRSL
jgi:hypothetical protein